MHAEHEKKSYFEIKGLTFFEAAVKFHKGRLGFHLYSGKLHVHPLICAHD